MPSTPDAGHRLRVLLCEPYFTGSHRVWAEGLAAHSAHDVRLVTHAGGFWKWRMQGSALTLAAGLRDSVAGWGRPDVVLATDMVHLPALLGLARDTLADVPAVLYMHENQLTYPTRPGEAPDDTYAMTNWLSMATADRIVFNSEHHRRDVAAALPGFLRRFPDHRHTSMVDEVLARAVVLPVGIDADRMAGSQHEQAPGSRPTVLWNHRWEYDKDPTAFFAALDAVAAAGVDFGLAVAGESFQTVPADFEAARRRFADRLVHFGTAPADDYPALLRRADVVVSTARHEFFGVGVVEAMAAGAVPVVPARLSYPELLGPDLAPLLYGDERELVPRLCAVLTDPAARARWSAVARARAASFDWRRLAPRYDDLLADVAVTRPDPR